MKAKILSSLVIVGLLCAVSFVAAAAASDASFITTNPHVDGEASDACKNANANCNSYDAKEYAWLDGLSLLERLEPEGFYFFAVLVPGGQGDPNDSSENNLSDDFDAYTDRTFAILDGQLSYAGTHWLDSGKNESAEGDPKPNGLPPYIRIYPYADTTNQGGVYILAVCSLENGYPVSPRDCNYEAFMVREGAEASTFYLSGTVFEDFHANGTKDTIDTGLKHWSVVISGTEPDGLLVYDEVFTDKGGFWEYHFPNAVPADTQTPGVYDLTICEALEVGWTQSYPGGSGCHQLELNPGEPGSLVHLDFGNWRPAEVTACNMLKGKGGNELEEGWPLSLIIDGEITDTQPAGRDGCFTWADLPAGVIYGVYEESAPRGFPPGELQWTFPPARSGESLSHTFTVTEGCTPGFWQGGNDSGSTGGKWLWDENEDTDWVLSGGAGWNPFSWTTPFNSYFTPYPTLDSLDMLALVGANGGLSDDQKAARDLIAAYLNSSWGMYYPYTTDQLAMMWADAVTSGNFMDLHLLLDEANNAQNSGGCPIHPKNNREEYLTFLPVIIKYSH